MGPKPNIEEEYCLNMENVRKRLSETSSAIFDYVVYLSTIYHYLKSIQL